MMVNSDYVTLHINGVRYLEKAPLIYWLVAFSYRIFGVNEFATRLPTLLAMFLLVFMIMEIAIVLLAVLVGVWVTTFASLSVTTPSVLMTMVIA